MQDYYFIHRLTGKTQPVLVEYGFIDNSYDRKKLELDLLKYVEGVVKAIAQYTGYKYILPNFQEEDYYIVVKGDSLYSIAKKYNTTVDELKKLNNLTTNNLEIGQLLKISEEISQEFENIYVVQKGDSLYVIANKFGTTVDELKKLNNLTSSALSIGQQLIIPGEEEPEDISGFYIVQKGDSLWSIAKKFDTTVDSIKKLNNLTSNNLEIGQQLKVIEEVIPNDDEYTIYKVQKGDSLWTIAKKFNVSVDEIKTANELNSNLLSINQELIIPVPTDSVVEEYIVQKGDSLWTIARNFNMTVDELKNINNLDSNLLSIGQKLIVKK